MASEWSEHSFADLIKAGYLEIGDGYRAKNSELGGDGPIFLRAGHVRDTHIDFNGVDRFREELRHAVSSKMSKPGDVIITTKGNSTGRTSYIDQNFPSFVYSPHLSYWRSLDHNMIVPGFLRYWAKSEQFRTQLAGMSASTDMAPYLSLVDQKRLGIVLPSIEEQKYIGRVLGSLDDKIDLNRKMNETLEAMARALFKSWFVDFDPVRAKAEGRDTGLPDHISALFPDSFQDSELGRIPRGWTVGRISDVALNPRHSVSPEQILEGTPYIALEHMPRKSIALPDWGTADEVESGKLEFRTGEILFGKLRPYFHKVGIAPLDGVCSTDILVINPTSPEWFGFALGHLSSAELIDHANAGSTGTKMPRTNWNELARFPVVLPPLNVARTFNKYFQPIGSRIIRAVHENKTLGNIRDALLPKLISGEIRIEDALHPLTTMA